MNNQKMNEFLTLARRDIWDLIEIHRTHKIDFGLDIENESYSDLSKTIKRGGLVANLIRSKPKQERESHFLGEANIFCNAVEEEEFGLAQELREDLEYFKHCFLEDSQYHKCPIKYDTLKGVLDSI